MDTENGMQQGDVAEQQPGFDRYLSPISVWALAFGCSVGWGSFVMPGTTFLPLAGPLGTALGIAIGAVVMLIIGMNYHFLMNRIPKSGGILSYTIEAFGYDHGFLSSWFLVLVYVAIIWANATALVLVGRNLLGSLFQFGFHYRLFGYDIFLGETLVTIAAILIFGMLCIFGKKLAAWAQTVLAVMLFAGVLIAFFSVWSAHQSGGFTMEPLFAANGMPQISQVIGIVVLAPWAYVGFESVSHSAEEIRFSAKKTLPLMAAALLAGAIAYTLLSEIAAAIQPVGYGSWRAYIADLPHLDGMKGLPVFFATHEAMGLAGLLMLGVTLLSAVITGLIGNFIAASRLLYAMGEEGILPKWFCGRNEAGAPKNALLFLMAISLPIPFLGRTAIGWIVDVTTVGAAIAYGYTSADAYAIAKREKDTKAQWAGLIGLACSVFFFLYFMAFAAGAMATESYLILAVWSILGFVYFRYVFEKDTERRFGKSMIVWIGLLFLIFFTSLLWVRQATNDMTERVITNISEYYEEHNPVSDPPTIAATERYLEEQMEEANHLLVRNSIIQMGLIVATLAIMFSLYSMIVRREEEAELEKAAAEESSKAKTVFLSNMSHDIRTPMNAIIGYVNLAEDEENDEAKLREYLAKIKTSSHHLLALINDVLEMSRIESGKMDLESIPVNLKKTLAEVEDMFSTQMEEKNIEFRVDASQIKNTKILCDKNRLNRVLLNLLSNAYKFTPEGGTVSVTAWQIGDGSDGFGHYELRVADSGIGMTPEFAAKVFEAFERERTSTVSGIQGTGLGMAITKSIIDLMGGTIEVNTAPDSGTEFVIKLAFALQKKSDKKKADAVETEETDAEEENDHEVDFTAKRLLLVEDMEINREIALMLLTSLGFKVETAENGQIAVDKVKSSEPGYFDAVLMDIQMPVMDGYEAAAAIRGLFDKKLSSIPIVAMTANAFSEDVKKALAVGMNGHIAKPIDVNNMTETLKEVLQ
ncbi:MAG: amino acid permease [Lachnospiraceae bacterium]|nr:amino acid permease [Lachnospiraceae bacterium]